MYASSSIMYTRSRIRPYVLAYVCIMCTQDVDTIKAGSAAMELKLEPGTSLNFSDDTLRSLPGQPRRQTRRGCVPMGFLKALLKACRDRWLTL